MIPVAADGFCPTCGAPATGGHDRCAAALELDPPRFCARCGRRLDVQVFPQGYRATCRTCDGVHPARTSPSPRKTPDQGSPWKGERSRPESTGPADGG